MRLLIVSNRLPYTVVEKDGILSYEKSAGGLATGIGSYLEHLKKTPKGCDHLWIGWPGSEVSEAKKEEVSRVSAERYDCHPVYVGNKEMEEFYEGFCNKTIWPLFHYFPSYAQYDESCWSRYREVNTAFCDALVNILQPDDVVWVHDYHLMLLPKLIKDRMPSAKVGFFLHIPFPSYEIFRLLPRAWRRDILEGMLGADLVGFHTQDYTQYFLRCVMRILGYDHNMGRIFAQEGIRRADTFPMGIDYRKFHDSIENPEVLREKDRLRKAYSSSKIVLSIDRLDYSKGIINRLRGYETFLERNPSWHKKVLLSLVVVPSRTGVEHYQMMKKQIDEYVGKINGRFGSADWTPISYMYTNLQFESLIALYSASDVALVTPLRDGMNLVAKEYIATRSTGKGVLILSEMAGAAKVLGEAIIINPNHKEEIADALKEALEMPTEEQIKRNRFMQKRVEEYNVIRWAEDFLDELEQIKEEQGRFDAKLLGDTAREQLVNDYVNAEKRLILLDYDGVLTPFSDRPQDAKPSPETLSLLKRLSDDPRNEVVIVSGRDKNTLDEWLKGPVIGLVAEHGVWIKEKEKEWTITRPLNVDWKAKVRCILARYVDRVPGSFIEEKDYSLAWHYRKADPEFASLRTKELTDNLINLTANIDLQVLQGNKVLEIRNTGVNKGSAAMHFYSKESYGYVMAIGDDWTDEDMFTALPRNAYTIKVGIHPSHARFNLLNYKEAQKLLEALSHISDKTGGRP